jgi:diguanylate cyclase (GGDEF)-like protein
MRTEAPISFVLLDLDDFNPFNRLHGYLSGNAALVRIARALEGVVHGPGTRVARCSGNQFAAILPVTPLTEAHQTAERLRDAVARLSIDAGSAKGEGHLAATAGAHTLYASDDASLFDLVEGASNAIKASRGQA